MTPAFARRTPQEQPLTSSGRPKRATTLRKEALKEEEEEAKLKAETDKSTSNEVKKTEAKKGHAGRPKGSSNKKSQSGSDDHKIDTDTPNEKEEESSDKGGTSVDEPVEKALVNLNPCNVCQGPNPQMNKKSAEDIESSSMVNFNQCNHCQGPNPQMKEKSVEDIESPSVVSPDCNEINISKKKKKKKKKKESKEDCTNDIPPIKNKRKQSVTTTDNQSRRNANKKQEESTPGGVEIIGEMNAEKSLEGVSDQNKDSETDPDDGEVDDDDDQDFDPDDDPEKLWCFCKKPHGNRFMICCDSCEDWFHGDCIGITMERGREMERTGEEWCCNACADKKAKAALKKTNAEKSTSLVTSPLNTPIGGKKPLDSNTSTKSRSISLDSMKANLAKSLKGVEKAKPLPPDAEFITNEEKTLEQGKSVESTKLDLVSPEKPASTKEKEVSKPKRRESNKQEFRDLLTFDQIPIKREDSGKRRSSQEQSNERKHERHDSQSSEDDNKKRKKEEVKKTTPSKVRFHSQSKPVEPPKMCARSECNRPAMKGAIYCNRECIYKYANECLRYIDEEKKKNKDVGKSPDTKQESSKGTVICPATSSTDRVSETTQERIAVFEKSTGKVVAGVMAPTKKYLFAWLEEHPSYEVLKPGKQPADIKNLKNQDEVIRCNVRKSLRDILVLRCKETEMAINHDVVGKLSKKIESELLKMFNNETGQKYKTKYRSLIFNLKDRQNKILYKRVVSGEISPRKLVQMSPEQLATPELAQWREQENKHHLEMVKKREQDEAEIKKNPPIKKTHKGEVVIDEEKVSYETLLELKSEPTVDRKPKPLPSDMENLLKDTTEEHSHHLFDSNCKICTGKVAPPGESQVTGVSTTIIQAVPESSMPSPQLDEAESYVSSSPPSPDTSSVASPGMSPSPTPRNSSSIRKQPSVWRGFIMMQKVAKFVCTAYAVSGSCESLMDILPDSIHVCGRIPPSQVWDYLGLLREGRKSHYKYLDVIRFEMSSDEEKSGYIKLYTYFYTRQRIGVIGNCYAGIKDIYILPLASHDPIPTELRPLPGLPKPRPHMLLGIIVRVKAKKSKVSDFVDSSPEMVIPKKKKKKKDKKKEKDLAKDAEKEKADRDLERERAEITLQRERVELEAQKKLIDIIFKNRANEGLAPEPLVQAPVLSVNVSPLVPHVQPQSVEALNFVMPTNQFDTASHQAVHENVGPSGVQKMNEEHEEKEEERIGKSKEQEEMLKRQSEIDASQQETEVVLIPDPESIAKNIRENVLNQISDAIQEEVSEPEEQTGIEEHSSVDTTSPELDFNSAAERSTVVDPVVDNIVSLRNINASLVRPLTAEEKDPVYKAWLERPTAVNPIRQQSNVASMLKSENELSHTEVPVNAFPDISPTTQVQSSSGFTSPTSSMDQAHVQTLLSSISSSIAHVQAMVVSDPNHISVSDERLSVETSFQLNVSSSSLDEEGELGTNYEDTSDLYSSNQEIDQDVLQDIEERFRPLETSTEEKHIPSTIVTHSSESATSDISPFQSPTDMQSTTHPDHSMLGIVDISPPSKPSSPARSPSPMKQYNTIPLVGSEEDERQKSDDDYALDLIEDIKIPTQIPRRATLFSLDLIKMRAGIKMPELPDIKLPDKNDCKLPASVAIPPPPIPAVIPTVPIPPDIKLPPGVPFPPLPPAPPPSSDTAAAMPVVINPVEDIRSAWNGSCTQSVANSSCNRPVSSIPMSTVDISRLTRPTSTGPSSDPGMERELPLTDSCHQPVNINTLLPIRSMECRGIPSRDARPSCARSHTQYHDNALAPDLTAMITMASGHGCVLDPMFRGMPPPMQNIPGLRHGMRMPSSRLMDPSLCNRFPPSMPPGPMHPGPMPPGPMPLGPMPPGPMPQRPMLGNRFPHPVSPVPMQGCFLPPGRLQSDRFPLDQPVSSDRGFRSPIKNMDNPAMRNSNPRNFDIRKSGPPPEHPLKFKVIHDRGREDSLREPLFDVPLPGRPLDLHLDIDRPDRMPLPFESIRPPFKPDVQRPQFESEKRPSFEPEIRPSFEPERSRSPFESETHRPPFKSEHSTNSRIRSERSPPPRDHGRSYPDEMPYYEDYDADRRDRKHNRTDYDRSDQGYSRNNRGKFNHKNRQKFGKYDRRESHEGRRDESHEGRRDESHEGRRDSPRSSEFRNRPKNEDVRDRHDSKSYSSREDGPSKVKRTKPNKYAALSTKVELEELELEEGEVL